MDPTQENQRRSTTNRTGDRAVGFAPCTRERLGNGKIEGELIKLGYAISEETVANILKRHAIPPAPERRPSLSWRHLMTHHQDQILACDFFTVETLFLKTIYVLVFIELGTRRVHFAGCTAHPTGAWVTQQTRQVMWELAD